MRTSIFPALALCLVMPGIIRAAQVFTSQDVLDAIQLSNLNSLAFPWTSDSDGSLNDGKIKRWDISSSLVAVKFDTISSGRQTVVNDALNLLESSIGMTLFDRTSLNGVAENLITRGLVISYGTSHVPGGTSQQDLQNGFYQGNVSAAPYASGYPTEFLQPDGTISTRLYINLGNSEITDPETLIVVHEFAHALGLGTHFVGFGLDDALGSPELNPEMDDLAFAALSTIYRNAIGTTSASITVFSAPEAGATSLSLSGLAVILWFRTRLRTGPSGSSAKKSV